DSADAPRFGDSRSESRSDQKPERNRKPDRQRDAEDDGKVLGLGDHVPSFLMRPVRVRSQA
ncbi:MAG: DEAD/DEAH box helicase, partial [Beijerinckiaceae bacterium]